MVRDLFLTFLLDIPCVNLRGCTQQAIRRLLDEKHQLMIDGAVPNVEIAMNEFWHALWTCISEDHLVTNYHSL